MKGAVRRAQGFVRYALRVQYHGGSFLGVSYQKNGEDCIVTKPHRHNGRLQTIDLTGQVSVEGRLRTALDGLFGATNWENIQVSSRTDRGVHALKNTFHVDIKNKAEGNSSSIEEKLRDGLNFHLSRQSRNEDKSRHRPPPRNDLRITRALRSPEYMDNTEIGIARGQPPVVDWNARFSATQRTYVYRLLLDNDRIPFEWDRAWCLPKIRELNTAAMEEASELLVGVHDFTAFRGRLCQRQSPVVDLRSVAVAHTEGVVELEFVANSFLYRQVRNMVGCLVEVGTDTGRLRPNDVRDLIHNNHAQPSPRRYTTAPPQGLFLVDVQHGDLEL